MTSTVKYYKHSQAIYVISNHVPLLHTKATKNGKLCFQMVRQKWQHVLCTCCQEQTTLCRLPGKTQAVAGYYSANALTGAFNRLQSISMFQCLMSGKLQWSNQWNRSEDSFIFCQHPCTAACQAILTALILSGWFASKSLVSHLEWEPLRIIPWGGSTADLRSVLQCNQVPSNHRYSQPSEILTLRSHNLHRRLCIPLQLQSALME